MYVTYPDLVQIGIFMGPCKSFNKVLYIFCLSFLFI